jgi:hypothetical protein
MHGCLAHDSFGKARISAAARDALARLDRLTLFLTEEYEGIVADARALFSRGEIEALIVDAAGGYILKADRDPITFNSAQPLNLTFLGRPYQVIEVDIEAFDRVWHKDGFDYEPDGDPAIMASLARAAMRGIALPPPAVAYTHEGWGFFEGRGRLLYMRESGFKTMPLAVPVDDAKRLRAAAGMALPDVGAGAAGIVSPAPRPYADILDAIGQVAFYVSGRIATAIMMCAIVGGEAETARIAKLIRRRDARKLAPVLDFETPNVNALNELRMSLMGLIREVSDDQRQVILDSLKTGVARGLNPVDIAREFRGSIGLTSAQQRYVENYRRALERVHLDAEAQANALGRALRDGRFDRTISGAGRSGKALSQEQIDKMVGRYQERMVMRRAETIARTEALTAAHMGEMAAWQAAIDSGDIRAEEITQSWLSAHDARVRITHRALDGQQRQWGAAFDSISGAKIRFPGDPLAPAAERINCRCVLIRQISEQPLTPDASPVNYADEIAQEAADQSASAESQTLDLAEGLASDEAAAVEAEAAAEIDQAALADLERYIEQQKATIPPAAEPAPKIAIEDPTKRGAGANFANSVKKSFAEGTNDIARAAINKAAPIEVEAGEAIGYDNSGKLFMHVASPSNKTEANVFAHEFGHYLDNAYAADPTSRFGVRYKSAEFAQTLIDTHERWNRVAAQPGQVPWRNLDQVADFIVERFGMRASDLSDKMIKSFLDAEISRFEISTGFDLSRLFGKDLLKAAEFVRAVEAGNGQRIAAVLHHDFLYKPIGDWTLRDQLSHSLRDIIGSVSRLEYGGGHDFKYYYSGRGIDAAQNLAGGLKLNDKLRLDFLSEENTTEAFANWFQMYTRGPAERMLMRLIFPEMNAAFEGFLKSIAGRRWFSWF